MTAPFFTPELRAMLDAAFDKAYQMGRNDERAHIKTYFKDLKQLTLLVPTLSKTERASALAGLDAVLSGIEASHEKP